MLAAGWLYGFAAIVQWINSSESFNSYFYESPPPTPPFFLGIWFGGGGAVAWDFFPISNKIQFVVLVVYPLSV